jgi:glycolate oxidase
MSLPDLRGAIGSDPALVERCSRDMSSYRVRPRLVAAPADEGDVLRLLAYAAAERLPVTCRGAGSNLSGSAVGPGLVVLSERMSGAVAIGEHSATVQPGIRYEQLNRLAGERGLALRYDVSSGRFSTIGGNISTKAGGLRSVRYGNAARWVRAVRFVSPALGVVDTRGGVPAPLAAGVRALRRDLLADERARAALARRGGLKTASGYNLRGLVDAATPEAMVAQLMVGSVGTLGALTEIEVALLPAPRGQTLLAAFFARLEDACALASELVATGPSALEAMDEEGTRLLLALAPALPGTGDAGAVLLVEHEETPPGEPGAVPPDAAAALRILEARALTVWHVPPSAAEAVWNVRWSMLTSIRRAHESAERRFLSFVDDLAVPVAALGPFLEEVRGIFKAEGVRSVIYGHLGEGNLHMRPLIEREGWRDRVRRIADRCFEAALRRGGTLTAEHGSGRNRAPFLAREWGERLYGWFRRVKNLFDPDDLLNPGVMFSDRDFTEDLEF